MPELPLNDVGQIEKISTLLLKIRETSVDVPERLQLVFNKFRIEQVIKDLLRFGYFLRQIVCFIS